MRKTNKIKKLVMGFVILALLNANIIAEYNWDPYATAPKDNGYWGGAGGGTATEQNPPKEPENENGGSTENEDGGQSGGTENPGGASGGGGQQISDTPQDNQDDEEPVDDGEKDDEDTEKPNDDGKGKEEDESERRYREAVRALQESEEILAKFDSLYNVEKAKFYTAHKEEIRRARDLKAAAEATLKAKALVD